jgi:hypothetical protein
LDRLAKALRKKHGHDWLVAQAVKVVEEQAAIRAHSSLSTLKSVSAARQKRGDRPVELVREGEAVEAGPKAQQSVRPLTVDTGSACGDGPSGQLALTRAERNVGEQFLSWGCHWDASENPQRRRSVLRVS